MVAQAALELMPNEILYYICAFLPFTDVASLQGASMGRLHETVHKYMMERGRMSTKVPLHELVNVERTDCIEDFAAQGAVDVNATDHLGRTALHAAAQKGIVAMVRALLRFPNISLDIEDRHNKTPLGLAIWKGHLAVIELLIREGAAHQKALGLAVKTGHLELVKLLLRLDHVDINETNEVNYSPLLTAIKHGRTVIAGELLLRGGINTEIRERRNLWTAFMFAAARGQTSFLLQLLAHGGVNVHASDRDDRTALSLAADGGYLTMVELILSQGVDLHRVDRFGRTCLHYAAQGGHERVANVLIQGGCDPQLPDGTGLTPLRLAVKAKNDILVEMMLRATANIDYRALLVAAVEHNNEWAVREALRHVSPNIRHKGTFPLLLSTKPKIIKILLSDPRIDPNHTDHNGRTVLINAARNGWWSVVSALVAKDGLDIQKIDNNGQSASDYAANMNLKRTEKLLSNYPLRRSQLGHAWGQATVRSDHMPRKAF